MNISFASHTKKKNRCQTTVDTVTYQSPTFEGEWTTRNQP